MSDEPHQPADTSGFGRATESSSTFRGPRHGSFLRSAAHLRAGAEPPRLPGLRGWPWCRLKNTATSTEVPAAWCLEEERTQPLCAGRRRVQSGAFKNPQEGHKLSSTPEAPSGEAPECVRECVRSELLHRPPAQAASCAAAGSQGSLLRQTQSTFFFYQTFKKVHCFGNSC